MKLNSISFGRIIISLITAMAVHGSAMAQSGAVKKASESVFTLTTFNADGSIHATGHGTFTGKDGVAISNLKPFIGAHSAIVIDSKGKKLNVTRMMGINDIYDVAKFKVEGGPKGANTALAPATSGSRLWLLPYSNKQAKPQSATVKSVEKFMDKFSYYIFSDFATSSTLEACPFVNDNGEIVGLMQTPATTTEMHATDANFILSLSADALSINNDTYRKIGIPTILPTDQNQATLALMMTRQAGDSIKMAAAASDFIKAFPNLIDGYAANAQMNVEANLFDNARKTMETALANCDKKEDAHYNYAKIIYSKMIYKADVPYAAWDLNKALEETAKAYDINPQPIYKDLEAQILFAQNNYDKAYEIFMALTETKLRNSDLFYNAALCKDMLKAPDTETLALLDSAINTVDSLNIREAAKSFLMRGDVYNRMGNFRQAAFDYTRYQLLTTDSPTAAFFYMKEQVEVKAKLFKQALADIDNAIFLAPQEASLKAEKAQLQLRLNLLTEAIATAQTCVDTAPEYSDGYLILGLAQVKNGNKSLGLVNMNKAKELGNSQAQALIEKYAK